MKTTRTIVVMAIALTTMLMFAVPSFADTVYFDFAGNDGHGGPSKLTVDAAGTTFKGNSLPIFRVTADGVSGLINAYLKFEISPTVTSLSIMDSASSKPWLTSNNFTYSGGTTTRGVVRDTLFTIGSGAATLEDYGFNYLEGKGLTLDRNLEFQTSTIHIVEVRGQIQSVSLDLMGTTTTVPEPMTAALLLPGIGLLGLVRRRFLA